MRFSIESSTLSLKITRLTSRPLYSGCSARGNSLASMKKLAGVQSSHPTSQQVETTTTTPPSVAPTEDHLFPESKAGKCNLASSFFSYIRFSPRFVISIPSWLWLKMGVAPTTFFRTRCRKHLKLPNHLIKTKSELQFCLIR